MRAAWLALALGAVMLSTGCGTRGLLYTHVTRPLDVNFNRTPVYDERGRDSIKDFNYSYVRVVWGSAGIGAIAKRYRFKRIHYADLETITVLGVWTQQYAHVYGEQ